MTSPVLALVGCGAIADFFHLPALKRRPDLLRSLILVDRDIARAEAVRASIGAARAVADYREIIDEVEGAVIATPHHLHHPITLDFVRHGVPVLCEKPLAASAAEVDEIVEAAAGRNVQVAVNHTRRLFSSFTAIQKVLAAGELGEVRSIEYELGEPFAWPAATDGYFGTKAKGRGVLYDTGAHIIDLVCWWMGGEPEIVDYQDDARGGTEAVARVTLRRGATTAHVHLSWLSKLRNNYSIRGTRGTIEGGVYEWSSYTHRSPGGTARKVKTDRARTFDDFADRLIGNFVDVVAKRAAPIVSAADARHAIAVIDGCYARRAPIAEPWHNAFEVLAHV
jgi:predicted dehydrogenase